MTDSPALPSKLVTPPLTSALRALREAASGLTGHISRTDAETVLAEIERLKQQRHDVSAALMDERAAPETPVDHSGLLARLPHVDSDFVAEVQSIRRAELEARILVQKDWLASYSQCLDGLGLRVGVEKCRNPKDIRRIVESLTPTTRGSES